MSDRARRIADVPQRLVDRFDGILSALAHCTGAACRNPYTLLHPGQPVFNLTGVSVWCGAWEHVS